MKKTLPLRLLAIVLCVAMLATVTPIFASAESTTYLDYNATTGKVDTERTVSVDNVIDEATDSFVTGWNIVEGSVEFGNRITLPKDVNLILADGATLTAKLGITVAEDGNFAVYAQSNDAATMGKLIMTESVPFYKPGIGSDEGKRCGNISIYGGTVTARGGMYAAGIGSGDSGSTCGTVTIYGGVVTATGGNSGAGIGSGFNSACDDITIIGGIVTAQGGVNSSGIGSGVYASCNGVTISGGYVKATAGAYSAPIGAGYESETVDVSIDASCTSVTKDSTQYINYQIPAKAPTCTEGGFKAYFQDPVSGNFYDAVPLTEDTLIGDATALAAWKAESGAGYVARIPHVDENEDDICDVCSAAHVAYLDYNETTGAVDTEHMVWVENVIDEATDSFVSGWNYVKGSVEFEDRIVLPANVKLILANGATLTAKKGITVAEDGDFAVYAQSNDAATMGKLIVPESTLDYYAGIGCEEKGSCGNIAVYGGALTVMGGYDGAAIGSGFKSACGDVSIYGGIVTAMGGGYGAGIGSGSGSGDFVTSCGIITISGGVVTAQGGESGAGIGSGWFAACDEVNITGGYVKATAGANAEPIGAGYVSDAVSVSIDSSCTSVTKDGVQYINYQIPAKAPTCTEGGFKAYFQDPVSGNSYDAVPLTEDTLIGDATALAAWKAQGGAGYVEMISHIDENDNDLCDVCETLFATYLDYNRTSGAVDTKRKVVPENVIDEATDSFVSGWNYVKGSVEFEDRIVLPANVKLILANGATLTAKKGITVAEDGDFSVYAQSNDAATMGKLIVPESVAAFCPGIGSSQNGACGNIAIYGGTVTTQGGMYGAGIGSGDSGSSCGTVTIYGGVVTATAGAYGAGIGSGYNAACGDITILGGNITAQGGYQGAGIGSGYYDCSCGTVTISGGYVKATPGEGAEPIGAGCDCDAVEVSIDSSCTSVTKDNVQYINYEIPAKEPTCTESGFKAYFQDPVSGNFYDAVPLTADTLIGDATALAAWKAKGGNGYVAPLPHADENDDDVCDDCEAALTRYLNYNETTGKVDAVRKIAFDNVIDEATDSFVTGWNVVKGSVEFEDRIVLPANVNLILADGATLTAKKGITVAEDGNFAVYAQSNDAATMGKLIVPGAESGYAGIGSSNDACGDIAIYGGAVTAQGGVYASGIGSGDSGSSCGTVTIYGGVVTATAGAYGAGIGSGYNAACGDITIIGGIVTAQGGYEGAGIGSGYYDCSCGTVTISGGYVKATPGEGAEPIGAGCDCDAVEVSIDTSCMSVTKDNVQYINYEIPAKEPTCTESGFKAYFQDPVSGNFYDAVPLTADTLIGDATALAAWKAKGGNGYVAPLPHADENDDDVCDDCEAALTRYLNYNETTGKVDAVGKVAIDNVINEATDSFVSGWNIVKGNVEFENRIELPKDVNLILANGSTLTAKKGITVAEDGDFAVYAQSNDAATMGKLIVPAGVESGYAGIGSNKTDACGNIAIYGGKVTVQGGMLYAAGIGSGDSGSSCGAVTIYGGVVTATAGAYGAGIGSGYDAPCGDITIYGGVVNAQGGTNASGIGSGYYSACGDVTISGGIVEAKGGYNGAGIGSGSTSSCGTITISGGYVKATAGADAESIGAGYGSETVEVSIDTSCTAMTKDTAQYINYEPFAAVEPTCTENGTVAYFKDSISGNYYTAFPFTADGLIGDDTALAAWKAEGGAGYIAPLGHDWQFVDETTHQCARCEATAAHTGVEDYVCDDCGGTLLETAQADAARLGEAKGAAKAALDAAANPVGSEAQAQVLSDAKAAVDAATTLDGVATAKANGLSAIAAQKATELAAKIAQFKADITDNLLPAAKCDEAKAILNTALTDLDTAATENDANSIYYTAKGQASGKDNEFTGKQTSYKSAFPHAITDAVSEETEQFVEDVLDALDSAASIAALDEIYAENVPYINFHATKDNMLSQCKEILESDENTEAMKAVFEMTVEMLSEAANMDELEESYAYCSEQIEMQREREGYLPECEMILASDEYSDDVKTLVREFVEALNAAESLEDIEYVFYEYAPAINLQAARDKWIAELTELLPEEPSDAVTAIIEGASELILYGEDASIFDNVYDVARQAVERQLIAEANQKATEAALKQAEDDLAAANDTIDELNGTIDELNDTVKSKDATIAEKQAAIDTATEQLNAAKADLETAKANLETAKANLETAKANLETAKANIAELESTVSEKDEALAQAEQDLKSSQDALAQAEQDVKDLQAEIERLKALLGEDPTDPQPTEMLGDANGDGAVNMKDVLLMRKYLAGMDVEYDAENADCNADGTVNMKDVLLMRKLLAGLVEKLGA